MDIEDKLSIKNILFTKLLPNHEIPAPVHGYKIYPCIDCGDRFIFESTFNDHLNRKSVQITYVCRFCNQTKIFFNRCKLLYHIRSHAFKTATINVNDLKVEPIPLSFYKKKPTKKLVSSHQIIDLTKSTQYNVCFECKRHIPATSGKAYRDRADHFMKYTNVVHSCPVCLFALPTECALQAHLRFHLNGPPFCCPECGIYLPAKNVLYPYGHDCEGFKMMRATARLKCPVTNCQLVHPNDLKAHMKENHLKMVYKCPYCLTACFTQSIMNQHLSVHENAEAHASIFFQCELCPGRLVGQNNVDTHLRTYHTKNPIIFPCWVCGNTFKEVRVLIGHHIQKHGTNATNAIKNLLSKLNKASETQQNKGIYRVVKRCDRCQRDFTYKCNFNQISILPNECPRKCLTKLKSKVTMVDTETHLTCHLCKEKISENWKEIKKHYAKYHKMHKCLDLKVVLDQIDVSKYNKKTRRVRNANTRKVTPRKRQQFIRAKANAHELANPVLPDTNVSKSCCTICKFSCESKEQLETHFISHKDPCTAYQCMECGQSFVVKPSFSTHLMLVHGISNAEEYISNKNGCYNKNALEKTQNSNMSFEPLKDNQCKICREQFDSSEDLAKHFRGHGMAFLLKSTSNKNTC